MAKPQPHTLHFKTHCVEELPQREAQAGGQITTVLLCLAGHQYYPILAIKTFKHINHVT